MAATFWNSLIASSYIPFLPYSMPFSLIFFMSNPPATSFCRSSVILPADTTGGEDCTEWLSSAFWIPGVFLAAVFCAALLGLALAFFGVFCATDFFFATAFVFLGVAATLDFPDNFF